MLGFDAWKRQDYLLNRMTMRDLVRAYVTYPGVQIYLVLIAIFTAGVFFVNPDPLRVALSVGAAVAVYSLAWYLIHRFILHSRLLYKSQFTAALWKRVHYDHHRYPNDMGVLFGGLHTTIPTILAITFPIGWLIGGAAGALSAAATGMAVTCVYEFFHCTQHLSFNPKSAFMKRIKAQHLAHHFHDESGNYGIIDFSWDRFFGTHYPEMSERPRSATARNLGYDAAEAERYPWVAELSGERPARDHASENA